MLWGFFKKMALADNLAQFADQAYDNPQAFSGPHLLFASLAFALQIYCDFSGYSDIAIGTAKLFGFSLIRNFAYPYFSQSVPEFWRRWHISLSTWFRDYLFFPLGGSRVTAKRHMFNLVITFAISGLWHGAAWTYIFWGVLNGVAMFPVVMHRSKQRFTPADIPGGESLLPSLTVVLKIAVTFSFVLITWIFFRASSLTDAWVVLDRIFVHPVWHTAVQFSGNLSTKAISILVLCFIGIEWVQRRHMHALVLDRWPRPVRWAAYTTMIWLTLWLSPLQSGAFIYFQF
jgi:D-alanyl-lipoteichoic acid acyltransferase DltB (MBOAT superfamily)